MPAVTIMLPDELLTALATSSSDLPRAVLEALVLDAFRTGKISSAQLRSLLGFQTPMQVDAFLAAHHVELEYSLEDLARDRETHRQLGL
jgi:hypothetical protein